MVTTFAQLQQKYGAKGSSASSQTPTANSQPTTFQDLQSKYTNYQSPPAPAPQSLSSKFFGAAKNVGEGFVKGFQQVNNNLLDTGQAILNNTGGRVANIVTGKGNVPTMDPATYLGGKPVSSVDTSTQGVAQGVGKGVATVLPYMTGAGEEEAATTATSVASRVASALGKDVDQFLPKVAGLATKLGLKTAVQTPIATAQTGNVGSGIAQSAGASMGEEAVGAAVKGAGSLLKTGEQKLTEALTPYLTPKNIEKGIVSAAGKGEEFSASEMRTVKNSVQAVKDAASALGKQASTIVRSGVKTAEGNAARIGQAIGGYSKKLVAPMLKDNPVPFNFEDLRGAFANVMPKEVLNNPEATAAFKRVGESFLNVIAKSIKGTGRALSEDDFNDIWNSRKVMDNIITDERGANAFGTQARTGIDAAAKAYRGAFKQFLSDSFRYAGQMSKVNDFHKNVQTLEQKFGRDLSEEELTGLQKQMGVLADDGKKALADQWDKHMNTMSSLYDAIGNVATKAKKEYGKSWAELYSKAHPMKTKAAIGAGAIAGTAALGGTVMEGLHKLGI